MRPDILYYNCDAPHIILSTRIIKASKRHHPGVGGVSMSAWKELGTSGPFKIAFCRAPWFDQFKPCYYGDASAQSAGVDYTLVRNSMFKDEQEWWSPDPVRFELKDVLYVMRMTNAPSGLSKKVLGYARMCMLRDWMGTYVEEEVNDPYLRGETRG